jgi:hypothetical protein
MFQVFYLNVAKVNMRCCNGNIRMMQAYVLIVSCVLDVLFQISSGCFKSSSSVAHVAMVIHACFKHMFQVFHLSSDVCCICFIWTFQK